MKQESFPSTSGSHTLRLKQKITKAVSALISTGTPYALIDFPNYANIGDSAIWLGARAVLKDVTGIDPSYSSGCNDFSPAALNAALPDGPIFIQGGGNFGDLYDHHNRLKLAALAQTGRQVIQLPQSIHYQDERKADEMARAIGSHGNFTLMMRDEASAAFAKAHFDCKVVLAPDCAFAMGSLAAYRTANPPEEFCALLRTDDERLPADYSVFMNEITPVIRDWKDEPPVPRNYLRRSALASSIKNGRLSRSGYKLSARDAVASYRLQRGAKMLSLGKCVVTDRLHGHILSILLGIPDVALDNSTGKVLGYHKLWLSDLSTSAVASHPDEVLDKIVAVRYAALSQEEYCAKQ